MGARQELETWVQAKREERVRESERIRQALLAKRQEADKWKAILQAETAWLQNPNVRGAFETCAQSLRKNWEDVTLRITRPEYYKDNPKASTGSSIELTWDYYYNNTGEKHRWSCHLIGAKVERDYKTEKILGIRLFETKDGYHKLAIVPPVKEEIIAILIGSITNPKRERQWGGVTHPSLAKRIAASLSS